MPRTASLPELQRIYAAGHARLRARGASVPDLSPTMSASGSQPQGTERPRSNGWDMPKGPQALDELVRLAQTVAAGIVGPGDRRRTAPAAPAAPGRRAPVAARAALPRTTDDVSRAVRATWAAYRAGGAA